MKFENLENKRFGMLTVLELAPKTKNRSTVWICQCDCGNKTIARNKNLLEGITTDCGCISKNGLKEGQKIARLTLLKEIPSRKGRSWECVCDCGKQLKIREFQIRNGVIKSCGCLKIEYAKVGNPVHKFNKTRIQRIHHSMVQRCYNKNHIHYSNYGGRGITICDEWLGIKGMENFGNWALMNGYNDSLSIDRIDGSKGYYPENCKFSTPKEQANNTRKNIKFEYKGEQLSISKASEKYGISPTILRYRIRNWNNVERAIEEPVHTEKRRKKEGGN